MKEATYIVPKNKKQWRKYNRVPKMNKPVEHVFNQMKEKSKEIPQKNLKKWVSILNWQFQSLNNTMCSDSTNTTPEYSSSNRISQATSKLSTFNGKVKKSTFINIQMSPKKIKQRSVFSSLKHVKTKDLMHLKTLKRSSKDNANQKNTIKHLTTELTPDHSNDKLEISRRDTHMHDSQRNK